MFSDPVALIRLLTYFTLLLPWSTWEFLQQPLLQVTVSSLSGIQSEVQSVPKHTIEAASTHSMLKLHLSVSEIAGVKYYEEEK